MADIRCAALLCPLSHCVPGLAHCCDEDRVHTGCGDLDLLACRTCSPIIPRHRGVGLAFILAINSVQLCSKASHALPVSTDWLVLSCCSKHRCVTAAAYLIHFPRIIFHRCGGETIFTSKLKQKMISLQTVFPHFKQEQAPIHISTKFWQTTENTLMKQSPTQNTGRSKTKQKAVSVHCVSRGFMFTEWLCLRLPLEHTIVRGWWVSDEQLSSFHHWGAVVEFESMQSGSGGICSFCLQTNKNIKRNISGDPVRNFSINHTKWLDRVRFCRIYLCMDTGVRSTVRFILSERLVSYPNVPAGQDSFRIGLVVTLQV